jgi:hypothetical protein
MIVRLTLRNTSGIFLTSHVVTAGRTYPLEGAALPLPQHYPYTDPLQVLICGGSTIGGGYALDNCVTTAPESSNPTWTIERMVWLQTLSKNHYLLLTSAIATCYALHGTFT